MPATRANPSGADSSPADRPCTRGRTVTVHRAFRTLPKAVGKLGKNPELPCQSRRPFPAEEIPFAVSGDGNAYAWKLLWGINGMHMQRAAYAEPRARHAPGGARSTVFRPMGFRPTLEFINLHRSYGQRAITEICRFTSVTTRAASFKWSLELQHDICKTLGLIPQSLRLNRPVSTSFGYSIVAKAERFLLQARILDCKQTIRKLENKAFFARCRLECQYSAVFLSVQLHANFQAKLSAARAEQSHEDELYRLTHQDRPAHSNVTLSTVHSLYSHKPDPALMSVLSLGLNFKWHRPQTKENILYAVENAISKVEPSRREEARTRTLGALLRLRPLQASSTLSSVQCNAIKQLQANADLVILPADKGNATVLLDKVTYKTKCWPCFRNVRLDNCDMMVSFDVKTLFMSVSTDLAVEVCTAALESDATSPGRSPIDVPDLGRLRRFCLSNTYFTFDQVFYKQVHGTAMGASVSVTAANLTMEWPESHALNSFSPQPKIFVWYVDDCFAIIKKDVLFDFTAHLNSTERAVQFTVEKEENGQLPFLDVLVKRSQSMLSSKVYRESTHTGCYPHFHSFHPASHKRSVVASLFLQANRICTEPEDVKADRQGVRKDFSECGYLLPFVNAVERKLLQPPRSDSGSAAKKRGPVPYVPGFNDALARILRSYDAEVSHVAAKKLLVNAIRGHKCGLRVIVRYQGTYQYP
ncbi:uncharacterized protein LOC144124283 [Amblyomma americanum]